MSKWETLKTYINLKNDNCKGFRAKLIYKGILKYMKLLEDQEQNERKEIYESLKRIRARMINKEQLKEDL